MISALAIRLRDASGRARISSLCQQRELADVAVHDPHVSTPTQSFDSAVRDADAVVVATNHPEYCGGNGTLERVRALAGDDVLVVDPWNCFGAAQVFAYGAEIAALVAPSA